MDLTADALISYQSILPKNFFIKVSEAIELPLDKTKIILRNTIPEVFSALRRKSLAPGGSQNLLSVVQESDFTDLPTQVADDVTVNTQVDKGHALLVRVLGGNADALTGKIASATSLNLPAANKLMGAASAAVFAMLGSKMKGGYYSTAALSSLLLTQGAQERLPPFSLLHSSMGKIWPWAVALVALIFAALVFFEGNQTATSEAVPLKPKLEQAEVAR
jgi:hypothetical protein